MKDYVDLKLLKGERLNISYLIDGFLFHLYRTNQNGSKTLRCEYYQNSSGSGSEKCCLVSCTIAGERGNEYYINKQKNQDNQNELHIHKPLSAIEINYKETVAIIKEAFGDINERKKVFDEQIRKFSEKWNNEQYEKRIRFTYQNLTKKSNNKESYELKNCDCKRKCDKRCSCIKKYLKCTSNCGCHSFNLCQNK